MAVNVHEIIGREDVFGSDNEQIGKVDGISTDRETSMPILEVKPHFMADMLFVPQTAIDRYIVSKGVWLTCTKEEAQELFRKKPNVL